MKWQTDKQTQTIGESITLDNIEIPIIRSARRKHLALEVSNKGVFVRAPQRMLHITIKRFVTQKSTWIHKHLKQRPDPQPKLELINGTSLQLLGQTINLSIKHKQRGAARLDNQQLTLPVQPSTLPLQQTIKNKLHRWYKQQATDYLIHKVEHFAQQMSLTPTNIKIRDYKRRWGSCNHRGELSFNWRIIMAPPHTIDYVIIHELAHLQHFNHSKQFWALVETHMSNWQQHKAWFNQFGGDLYQI